MSETAAVEALGQALQNMHTFMAAVMQSMKEIENDEAVPAEHRLTLKAHRWDWEKRNGRVYEHVN